jgi:hypothetical protein
VTSDEKTTAERRVTIPVTRHPPLVTLLLMAGAVLFIFAVRGLAQPGIASGARGFTSVEYYPAPLQQQMRSRLSGAEGQPLPGGLLVIKHLKLETFNTNGSPQAVVEAPECTYDTFHYTASSAGHLRLQTGDGKIRTDGDGFLWRQDDSLLTISNNVHTVIETGLEMKAGL